MSHPADEVRRRACRYLAAHPDPAYVSVLLPALQDPSHAVVIGRAAALAAIGRIDDPRPVRQLLRSDNEEVQLEAAVALVRLERRRGVPALERMAYSDTPDIRAAAARAMGELGNAAFTAALVRLLDDPRGTVSRAALLSLPKAVGRDVAAAADGRRLGTASRSAAGNSGIERGERGLEGGRRKGEGGRGGTAENARFRAGACSALSRASPVVRH